MQYSAAAKVKISFEMKIKISLDKGTFIWYYYIVFNY